MDDTYLLSLSSSVAERLREAGDAAQVTLELDVSGARCKLGNNRRDLAFLVDGAVHNMWHLEGVGVTELWKIPIDAEIKTDVKPHTAKRAQDCAGKAIVLTEYVADLEEQPTG